MRGQSARPSCAAHPLEIANRPIFCSYCVRACYRTPSGGVCQGAAEELEFIRRGNSPRALSGKRSRSNGRTERQRHAVPEGVPRQKARSGLRDGATRGHLASRWNREFSTFGLQDLT